MSFRRVLGFGAIVIAGAAVTGWFGREPIQAWYFTHRLQCAQPTDVAGWVAAAGDWGPAVEGRLWNTLACESAEACQRSGAALAQLYQDRPAPLSAALAKSWETLSPDAQSWALEIAIAEPALDAATAERFVTAGLKHPAAETRALAVRLAAQPGRIIPDGVAALIHDPDAEIRRAVVLMLGSNRTALADDELLPRLHDPDKSIAKLARTALRSRGLTDQQIQMGRLLTDPRPASRLQLITLLREDSELDLSTWLRRLTIDPSPAVRAAAIRTTAELQIFQLADRIAEMAAADPDGTVRPIAQYHLRQIQGVQPVGYVP